MSAQVHIFREPEIPAPPQSESPLTVHEILAWFRLRFPCGKSKIAYAERWRLLDLFNARYGPVPYTRLSGDDLEDFVLTTGKAAKATNTVDRWYRTIKRPFKAATKRRKISFCPFDGIESPRGAQGRDLTKQEFFTILKHATPEFRILIAFMRYSSARPGEASKLEWSHVRDDMAILWEHKTVHATGHPRRIWWNDKTLKIIAVLKRRSKSNFVFVNTYGGPWKTRSLCKNLASIRKKAGLAFDVKNYGCRHYFATDALINECDLMEVMELMGHKDIRTTQRYIHLVNKDAHMKACANRAVGKKKPPERPSA
jgi:integrase/recombinase XerD